MSLTLTGGEWPEQIPAARVSANLFSVLGVAAALGRTFSPEEEALGAVSQRVVSMILRQGLTVALPGLAAGIVLALWLADAISALLSGVVASDLTSFAVASGLLLMTTLAASYLPARRAARVDPMTALRHR